MKKILSFVVSALLLAGLTSCSGEGESAVDPGYPTSTGAPVEPGTDGEGGGVTPTEGGTPVEREVIEAAFMSVEVEQLADSISAVKGLVASRGGFIDSWQQQTNDAGELWQVYATLRLPAASLDESLDALAAIGTVKSLERSATDVTTQVLDLDARIAALEASVQRLLALVEQATSTADLLEAEGYLSQRQGELDSLKSQREYLQSAIDYSTVSVSIYQQGAAAQDEPSNFWEGVVAGWNGLVTFLGGTLVVFGMISPWLAVLLPIGLVAWYLIRRLRSKRQRAE